MTAIIAIFAALAIPKFRTSYEEFRLKTLAQRFKWLTETAHELSMSEGKIYKIILEEHPSAFKLVKASEKADEPDRPLSGGAGRSQIIPEGYELSIRLREVVFYQDGSATPCEIKISNTVNHENKFEVDASGKIKSAAS